MIVVGSSSKNLGVEIAELLKLKIARKIEKRFPDGEFYVKIEDNLEDNVVILIQNSFTDNNFVELLILQSAIKGRNPKKLITVIPYFGYARQDRRFKNGEPLSAEVMANCIQLNSDEVLTVELHKESILDFFNIPSRNITIENLLIENVKEISPNIIIAPDKGAFEKNKKIANAVNCEVDFFSKERINENKVKMLPLNSDVNGKKVLIIDDIISTGKTIYTATKILKEKGAKEIHVLCIHGLFVEDAKEILKICDSVISTNTIEGEFSKISVAKEIANKILEIY